MSSRMRDNRDCVRWGNEDPTLSAGLRRRASYRDKSFECKKNRRNDSTEINDSIVLADSKSEKLTNTPRDDIQGSSVQGELLPVNRADWTEQETMSGGRLLPVQERPTTNEVRS
jgi:hypothetical protein